ncbi:amino acid adenylation domain-containing protein [Streptomyces sp. NPDC101227]|uniref:amino acid adenylation domain-containing protein n=1 Tax=Streptomyces sp. NPDC101227 TaxID=3366136 RepID=UPI003811E555
MSSAHSANSVNAAPRTDALDEIRLDGLLARAAKLHPDRPALSGAGQSLTYAELEATVEALAWQLAAAGLAPGDRIGVYAAKSPAAVLAIYAGLRAGAVVAPLDPADPPTRTARMVRNAGISTLLTPDRALPACHRAAAEATGASEHTGGVLDHGLNWVSLLAPEARSAPLPEPSGQGGYILFTSGSTGWPKGALLSHTNVAHFALWAARELGLTETDRIGSQASLSFDLTTFDLFSAAATGACAVLMPDLLRAFPRDVVGWLREQKITAFYAVPSLYHGMLQQGGIAEDGLPPALRVAAFAGEPFVPQLLQDYLALMGERIPFHNLYGPTETNVCTHLRVPPDWSADQELSIGRPIPGDMLEVLDEDGLPTDGEGEIHVAGPTVFQGYLQGGELRDPTVTVPFRDGTSRRAYATGDLGRIDEDGRVFLRGRRDSQVKRRGHRIDLLDVESAVLELPQVATTAVVAKAGGHRGEIWAYVQTRDPQATERSLLAGLRAVLPQRMLPDRVVLVAALPTTSRGKVDRLALSATEHIELTDHAKNTDSAKNADTKEMPV